MNHTPLGLWPKRTRAAANDVPFKRSTEITGRTPDERNDCTVVALAHALNVPYAEAWDYMAARGRKHRKAVYGFWSAIKNDSRFEMLNNEYCGRGVPGAKTILTFARKYNRGRYIVHVRGHALAVIDGVVHDYTSGHMTRRVDWAARVKESV